MSEISITKKPIQGFRLNEVSLEDRQKLIGAFTWLIQEDKKQNPALYKLNKTQNND